MKIKIETYKSQEKELNNTHKVMKKQIVCDEERKKKRNKKLCLQYGSNQ